MTNQEIIDDLAKTQPMNRDMMGIQIDLYQYAIVNGFKNTLNRSELISFEYLYGDLVQGWKILNCPVKWIKPLPEGWNDRTYGK